MESEAYPTLSRINHVFSKVLEWITIGLMVVLTLVVSSATAAEMTQQYATQAAVMDLWLAASLGLVLLYVRRRLDERRRARVLVRARRR